MCTNHKIISLYFALALSACGGGGSSTNVNIGPASDASLDDLAPNDAVAVIKIEDGTFAIKKISSVFGDQNLNDTPAFSYVALGADGRSVAGLESKAASIPLQGNFTYRGISKLYANNGVVVFVGDGSASVTYDASEKSLNFSVKDFQGTSINTVGQASVGIIDLEINGTGNFSSTYIPGELTAAGSFLKNEISESVVKQANLTFFGPNSEEVGGVFRIDDTLNGTLEIEGGLVGKK